VFVPSDCVTLQPKRNYLCGDVSEGGYIMPNIGYWGSGKTQEAILAIRLMVGGVFFLEGIKKFLFADQWGAGRFARIGIPAPHLMGPFVGTVEIICGLLVILGLRTSLAAIPLLCVISTAIGVTKIPILMRSGFWSMEDAGRTDYSMFMGLIFLVLAGSGSLSLDSRRSERKTP
ncbi:MAG: DoxX family protein, partial [Candidatus Acidiferrales bacterium]